MLSNVAQLVHFKMLDPHVKFNKGRTYLSF